MAWYVRAVLTRRRSHTTDPAVLGELLSRLNGLPATDWPMAGEALPESQVRVENDDAWMGARHLRFWMPSALPSAIPENRVIWGHWVAPKSEAGPLVVLLHPWVGPGGRTLLRLFGRPLLRRGIGAVVVDLPHHLHRTGRGLWSGELAVCGDLVAVVEAALQCLADLRRVIAWLRSRGATDIAVMGHSLGGWAAAVLAAAEPSLDLAVASAPPVRGEIALLGSPLTRGAVRRDVERSGLSAETIADVCRLLSPLSHAPLLPPERLLVVAATHDAMLPPEDADLLASHWRCEVWRERHGHITLFHSPNVRRRLANWIAARLTP